MHKALIVAALALTVSVSAQQDGRAMIRFEDVPWPSARAGGVGTSGAGGIETVVLKGDPAKPGLYTLMLRAGPNLRIQAHSHGDDRVATVVKGTWYFAYGETFNENALQALGPGSFYTEPPNTPHFAMTKEEVVIQVTGTGPSSTAYVNPATAP
jgi:quercetin dioxygenase-like cupin family protein